MVKGLSRFYSFLRDPDSKETIDFTNLNGEKVKWKSNWLTVSNKTVFISMYVGIVWACICKKEEFYV